MANVTDTAGKQSVNTTIRNAGNTPSTRVTRARHSDRLDDIWDSKANKSITNDLATRLSTAETNIGNKADQSALTTLQGTVTQNTTDIGNKANTNQIENFAKTTDPNADVPLTRLPATIPKTTDGVVTSFHITQDSIWFLDGNQNVIRRMSIQNFATLIAPTIFPVNRRLPAASATNNGMIAKIVNGVWSIASDNTSSGGTGLDTAAVTALINQLRPVTGRYLAQSGSGALTASDISPHAAVLIVNMNGSTNKTLTLPLIRAEDRWEKIRIVRVANGNDTANLVIQQNGSETGPKMKNQSNQEVSSITFGGSRTNNISAIELQIVDDNGIDNWMVVDDFNTIQPPAPAYDSPRITSFSMRGFTPPVPQGMAFNGSQTIDYVVENPGNVSTANLTLSLKRGSSTAQNIATNIDPNNTSATFTVSGQAATTSGTTYQLRLFGTDTQGNTFENIETFTVASQHEQAYFGSFSGPSEPSWGSVALPTNTYDVQTRPYSFRTDINDGIGHGTPVNNGDYFGILIPQNREPTSIQGAFGEAITTFTKRQGVRTISGQAYTVYFRPNNSGLSQPLYNDYTVSG